MRQILSFLLFTCLVINCWAQTQQGYVKTQGRPNKPGVPLANVTIRMKGHMNAIVSAADGKFNVIFPGKKNGDAIVLISVRKNGYELIDPEIVGHDLIFSTSIPIEIVMVSSAELEATRKRISDNAYRKAEESYQAKLQELEKQKQESDFTVAQYQQQLRDLQDKYDKYLALIDGMADRYARTDYDHLDSIDREINICIEEGELERADSLIHTVFDPTTVLERNRAAKADIQARMQLAQDVIDKANSDKEAIRRDSDYAKRVMALCESLAAEYLAQGDIEKARECLVQSLSIRQILYGEKSREVKLMEKQIKQLK